MNRLPYNSISIYHFLLYNHVRISPPTHPQTPSSANLDPTTCRQAPGRPKIEGKIEQPDCDMATITIRPRRDSDLPGCADLLRVVHSISGYPVNGVEDPLSFLCTDDRAWVAVRDDGVNKDHRSSTSDSNSATTVVGHAALTRAADGEDVAAALWRRLHPPAKPRPLEAGGNPGKSEGEQWHGGDDGSGGDDDLLVLGRLFVHPDARGRGVATRLIAAAVAAARARAATLVMLALVKDRDAIRLYRQLGWVHYGTAVYRWGEGRQMDGECFVCPDD